MQINIGDYDKRKHSKYKALTVQQPWADKIMSGAKNIEVRSKNTNHRGQLIITSSKVPVTNRSGITVCEVDLYDVKPIKDLTETELYKTGIPISKWGELNGYGWFLRTPKRLLPMEVKTYPAGIWNLAVYDELIRNEDFLREWKYENERKYPTWHIAAVVIAFWAAVFAGIYLLL